MHLFIKIKFSKLLAPKHFFPLALEREVIKLYTYMTSNAYYIFLMLNFFFYNSDCIRKTTHFFKDLFTEYHRILAPIIFLLPFFSLPEFFRTL